MINIKCNICGKVLMELGALLFSPPDENSYVKKTHICTKCYSKLLNNDKAKTRINSNLEF